MILIHFLRELPSELDDLSDKEEGKVLHYTLNAAPIDMELN